MSSKPNLVVHAVHGALGTFRFSLHQLSSTMELITG